MRQTILLLTAGVALIMPAISSQAALGTVKECVREFGKPLTKAQTDFAGRKNYPFENKDFLIRAFLIDNAVSRISFHKKTGTFNERTLGTLIAKITPKTTWDSYLNKEDGFWHFSGKLTSPVAAYDNYIYFGALVDNYSTVIIWTKEDLAKLHHIAAPATMATYAASRKATHKDTSAPVVPVIFQPPGLPLTVNAGVYDPIHTFDNIHTMTFEEVWCFWDKYNAGQLLPKLKVIKARGRTPIISIEPWPVSSIGNANTLLPDIISGKYDSLIWKLAKEINALGSPAIIRWGAEMEFVREYPWACKRASDYIAAFRHFADTFKETAPTSLMLWSPVGNIGCEQYYPGDDVVDYAAYSLYELPASSTIWFGHPMSFAQWMDDKYPRVAQFYKPIIIAELGVFDTPEKQKAWLQAGFAAAANYPLLKALVYFNAQDIHSWAKWGAKGAPNWAIDPNIFTAVAQ